MPVRAIGGRSARGGRRPLTVVNKLRDYSTPPPIGGWNARDSLANMEEDEAVELVNWFPEETSLSMRNGYTSHATGLGSSVDTVMSWNGPTSTKLFGATSTGIYDVTSSGAVGSPDVSGMNSGQWQHIMFSTSAGNYLQIVNGVDIPRRYTGSSWTTSTFSGSGLTPANLIHVNAFKNRLFFIEKNTLSFWYASVDSIDGTLTEFDLGPQATLGGYLVAMGTWTRDGGDGLDDLAVFITSRGEVIIYQGTDPSSANTWSKVGVFRIGAPIGRRCMIKVGAELIVITEDGFAPLSRQLAGGRATSSILQSDKISGAVQAAVTSYRDNFGWQPILYPPGDKLIFNIPQCGLGGECSQFVSHSATGAWCKFTGWNARCFEVSGNNLYFGDKDGNVRQADTGLSDNGANIQTTARTAFSYFGSRGLTKRFAMVRPIIQCDGNVTASIRVNSDYDDKETNSDYSLESPSGTAWDDGEWDEFEWGDGGTTSKVWQAVGAIGTSASLTLKTTHKTGEVKWISTDWKWEGAANAGYLP